MAMLQVVVDALHLAKGFDFVSKEVMKSFHALAIGAWFGSVHLGAAVTNE